MMVKRSRTRAFLLVFGLFLSLPGLTVSLQHEQGQITSSITESEDDHKDDLVAVPTEPETKHATTSAHGTGGHGDQGHDANDHGGHGMTHKMMLLVLQLGFILIVARICGELFERFLKQPSVLGELCAGMLIGPYALGPFLVIPGVGPLFALNGALFPLSPELYGVATIASIVLLFMVGLETDFHQFMRYAGPGFAVGIGGVAGSFITGDLLYVMYSGDSFMSPAALFMGTVSTATSVGITARVLSEKRKLDSAEGTTILAGAVIDDVLGILILAVVGGIAAAGSAEGDVDWGQIGMIALKAFGFWLGATFLGILLSRRIARFMQRFRTTGSPVALGFGMALLMAGVAETFGLAMIIGAYIMGLSLSKESIAHFLERQLMPIYACLVPIFFAAMGMLVNFKAMGAALMFGVVYSVVAVVSKVLGGGLPCYLVGFNSLGALRIGIGMLPRGEVALIVAGVGMSQGYIGQEMFGVVIMMTLVTTVIAPPMLVWLFDKPGEGSRHVVMPDDKPSEKLVTIDSLTWTNHDMLITCIHKAFEERGFSFQTINKEKGIYRLAGKLDGEDTVVSLKDFKDRIHLKTDSLHHAEVKKIVVQAHDDARKRVSDLEVKEVELEEEE